MCLKLPGLKILVLLATASANSLFAADSVISLPQARPGDTYDVQLAIPPGLGYPFARCEMTHLPIGLKFDCGTFQISGRAPAKSQLVSDIVLEIDDRQNHSLRYTFSLALTTTPVSVDLSAPPTQAGPTPATQADSASPAPAERKAAPRVAGTSAPAPVSQPSAPVVSAVDPARPAVGQAAAPAVTPATPPAPPTPAPAPPAQAASGGALTAPAAIVPKLSNPAPGTTLSGTGQPENDKNFGTVEIFVCAGPNAPAPADLDCTKDASHQIGPANPSPADANYFQTDSNGNFQATLAKPLAKDSYVWITQVATPTAAGAPKPEPNSLAEAVAVTQPIQPRILTTGRNPAGDLVVTGTAQPNTGTIAAGQVSLCVLPPANGYPYFHNNQKMDCTAPAALSLISVPVNPDGTFSATLSLPRRSGDYIAVTQTVSPSGGSPAPDSIVPMQPSSYDGVCQYSFNDCDYIWTLLGGLEQADLSSQSSQTEGFLDLFVRAPWNMRWGSIWLRSRFLGAPAATNTLNVATAATNASGFTTAQLPQNVFAVDYNIGFEHDFLLPGTKDPQNAMFTWGPILDFGATTPLDASAPTLAYTVPNYGTNECAQLQARFGAPFTTNSPPSIPPPGTTTPVTLTGQSNKYGYNPYLPPPGYYVTNNNGTPGVSTTPGCVVQPTPGTTVASVGQPGTQITTLAFSHEDRTSFLLKWQAGVRLINRWHTDASSVCSTWSPSSAGHANDGRCSRLIADISIGQDESITGGYLRHFVLNNDILLPIATTGLYFFGTASTRFSRNETFSPLILNSVPIASGANPTAGSVTIPSPSVFVLPLRQPNRDFYRIGFGIDVTSLIKPLVSK